VPIEHGGDGGLLLVPWIDCQYLSYLDITYIFFIDQYRILCTKVWKIIYDLKQCILSPETGIFFYQKCRFICSVQIVALWALSDRSMLLEGRYVCLNFRRLP
jgi:hypothetical protein